MTPDLQVTNTWLAILAVASGLQTLMLLAGAFMILRAYRHATSALAVMEQRHLAPLSARASAIMDDLQDVTARARNVDDVLRAKLQGLDHAARVAKDVVADRLWPAIGLARAVSAGVRAFSAKSPMHVTVPDSPIRPVR